LNTGTGFKTFVRVFLIATLTALIVRLCVVEDYRIASTSMYPTLWQGDLVFVVKSAYNLRIPFSSYEIFKFRRPKVGEVVAFSLPDRGIQTFVKRVVGVEGDRIEIKEGVLHVNGIAAVYQPFREEASEKPADTLGERTWEDLGGGTLHQIQWDSKETKNYGPVDVPPGHFFAMGDNRPASVDSRVWGPVPYSCLKGQVKLVWLSVGAEKGIRQDRIGYWVK